MLRLKNKRANVPNSYLYIQKETGWDASKVIPHTISDFNAVCQAIRQHRMSNPQLKLNTSLPAIEAELEQVTVARLQTIPGADIYLMDVGGAQPSSFPIAPVRTLQAAVVAVKAVSIGAKTILDFEESGQPPVSQELANKRAEICVACPLNGSGGLSRYFTIPAAAVIKARLEKLHEMKMGTPSDNQLGVCEACLCPLRLKVFTPIDFILKHLTLDVKDKLDSRCWILGEMTSNPNYVNLENQEAA